MDIKKIEEGVRLTSQLADLLMVRLKPLCLSHSRAALLALLNLV